MIPLVSLILSGVNFLALLFVGYLLLRRPKAVEEVDVQPTVARRFKHLQRLDNAVGAAERFLDGVQ
jgi:hypothetical protein